MKELTRSAGIAALGFAVWFALSLVLSNVAGLPSNWPATYASAVNGGSPEARNFLVFKLVVQGADWFESTVVPALAGMVVGVLGRWAVLSRRGLLISGALFGAIFIAQHTIVAGFGVAPWLGALSFLFCLAGGTCLFAAHLTGSRAST